MPGTTTIIGLLGLLILAACSAPQQPAATPTHLPGETATVTAKPPERLSPSATSQGTSTLTETAIASATPAPTSTVTPLPCWDVGGTMVLEQLETDLLRQPLEFRVYLPACYTQQSERRYPVLYLIHGQSYNDDQWDRLGADEVMDALVREGETVPFLIVMPRDRVWTQPGEDHFGEAVVDVLLPYIDATYRTLAERQYRAVGGLSRGASWAIHFGLKNWELFGSIGGHSPPVFMGDVAFIKRWLDAIPLEEMPRIYLDIGINDRPEIMDSAVWFENLLTQRNIAHEWHLFNGYHEEAYWEAHVEHYLRWYAQDW